MKTTVIVQVLPVWAQINIVQALSGLPVNKIRALTNDGKIRARKLGDSDVSGCLFRVQDAIDAVEEQFTAPGKFQLPAQDQERKNNG